MLLPPYPGGPVIPLTLLLEKHFERDTPASLRGFVLTRRSKLRITGLLGRDSLFRSVPGSQVAVSK